MIGTLDNMMFGREFGRQLLEMHNVINNDNNNNKHIYKVPCMPTDDCRSAD